MFGSHGLVAESHRDKMVHCGFYHLLLLFARTLATGGIFWEATYRVYVKRGCVGTLFPRYVPGHKKFAQTLSQFDLRTINIKLLTIYPRISNYKGGVSCRVDISIKIVSQISNIVHT